MIKIRRKIQLCMKKRWLAGLMTHQYKKLYQWQWKCGCSLTSRPGRKQSVGVGQKQSCIFYCKHGVPQGYFLGPILFTLCVVPLAMIITSQGVNHTHCAVDVCILYLTTWKIHPCCATASKQCNTGWLSTVCLWIQTRRKTWPLVHHIHTDGVIGTVDNDQVNLTTSHSVRSLKSMIDINISTNICSMETKCRGKTKIWSVNEMRWMRITVWNRGHL